MVEDGPLVRREDGEGVALLTLSSPRTRNALSLRMIDTLILAFADIEKDPSISVVVVAGEGPALSAGHDLKEIQAHRAEEDRGEAFFIKDMQRCAELMQAIVALPKPVIAAVEGVATAAGCQLVASCDLAVAGEEARFALPGVNIGLFCSTPLVAVGRAVSRKHAMEMALTGEMIGAGRAERIGLVNRVVAAGQAVPEALALAKSIAARSAATIALGKPAFYRQVETDLADAYAIAGRTMVENLALPDCQEGVDTFLAKRAPKWAGA